MDRQRKCRGCQSAQAEQQYDAHGITTGWWCNDCYGSNKYPYRKDKYPTIETHGYGEQLEPDPETQHWENMATWNERHSDNGADY